MRRFKAVRKKQPVSPFETGEFKTAEQLRAEARYSRKQSLVGAIVKVYRALKPGFRSARAEGKHCSGSVVR